MILWKVEDKKITAKYVLVGTPLHDDLPRGVLIVNRKRKVATTSTLLLVSLLDPLWNTTKLDRHHRYCASGERNRSHSASHPVGTVFSLLPSLAPAVIVGGNLFAGWVRAVAPLRTQKQSKDSAHQK